MKVGMQLSECIALNRQKSRKTVQQEAIGWMHKVQLPTPEVLFHRYPHQLSGGQKQRVMIAMAMCRYPALLLADEPTTALDATVQMEVLQVIGQLQKEMGLAVLFVTHDLGLAAQIADKILVLYQGKVMEYGPVESVLKNPQNPYTKALLACRPHPDQKGKRLPVVADFLYQTNVEIVLPPDKANLHTFQQKSDFSTTDSPILSVADLKVWFPAGRKRLGRPMTWQKAVDGVSFQLNKGEILGLVGESGCGKSTISKALMGIVTKESGSMKLNGISFGEHRDRRHWQQVRRQMQLIFQDPFSSLNPRMTIEEMLTEPLLVHNIVTRRAAGREVGRLLEAVQLPATAGNKYPHQFSGGQRQRIGIARALALKPQILICDESVSALDVSVQAQILNLLKDLQLQQHLSYLFISHDLNVVHYLSDRVMVMKQGKIVEEGSAEEVLKNPQVANTQSLVRAAMNGPERE